MHHISKHNTRTSTTLSAVLHQHYMQTETLADRRTDILVRLTGREIYILTNSYPITSTKDQSRCSFYYPHVHISLKCAIHSNRIALHNDRQVTHGSQYTLVHPLVKYSCSLYISFMWGNNDTIHTSMLWEVCVLLGVIDNWYVTTKSSRPESIFTRN